MVVGGEVQGGIGGLAAGQRLLRRRVVPTCGCATIAAGGMWHHGTLYGKTTVVRDTVWAMPQRGNFLSTPSPGQGPTGRLEKKVLVGPGRNPKAGKKKSSRIAFSAKILRWRSKKKSKMVIFGPPVAKFFGTLCQIYFSPACFAKLQNFVTARPPPGGESTAQLGAACWRNVLAGWFPKGGGIQLQKSPKLHKYLPWRSFVSQNSHQTAISQ